MRVLAFRHADGEDLGSIQPILEARGVRVECVDLYAGAPLPDARAAAGLIFMGGAMCANDGLDFLRREIDLLREAVHRSQPLFGVCLGAQLIAKALGAGVTQGAAPETGWSSIQLSEAAGSDSIFRGLEGVTEVFQLHRDAFDLPSGAVRLARSEACENQAFRMNETTYGVQFHPEMTPEMAEDWRGVLGLPDWLTPAGAYQRLRATCETLVGGWREFL